MLVLSRRVGERIVIGAEQGQQVIVEVAEIRGPRVLLRLAAPEDVKILREELTAAAASHKHRPHPGASDGADRA